ncbi:hypothetical protein ACFL5B_02345 [Candidatus Latescibacterota bacterium]
MELLSFLLSCITRLWSFITKWKLSKEEKELLANAAKSGGVLIIISTEQGGRWVQIGDVDYKKSDPAYAATYIEALDSIYKKKYISLESDVYYRLTGSGFKKARKLAKKKLNIMPEKTVIWKKYSVIINFILILLTGALAVCTYLLYSTSQKSLKHSQDSLALTKESVKQQSDYYKATTRPFVNSIEDSLSLFNPTFRPDLNTIVVNADTFSQQAGVFFTDFRHVLKNYGSSPAKIVQSKSFFYPYEDSTYIKDFTPGQVIYTIYPNIIQSRGSKELPLIFDDNKHSYLHIAIYYEDVAGNPYHSLSIFFIMYDDRGILNCRLVKSYFD